MNRLGDRMKKYEQAQQVQHLCPLLPTFARLDGRAFHSFTKGLVRPFDPGFSNLMGVTTQYLVETTGAVLGYTQSDEITLLWYLPEVKSELFFNGRIAKMNSILAALTSVYFNRRLAEFLPTKIAEMPVFDCRVWTVPTLSEAVNALIWREFDAVRNSILMTAQTVFTPTEMLHKNTTELKHMLLDRHNIVWDDLPRLFRRGALYQRQTKWMFYSAADLEQLPPQHTARQDPTRPVQRSVVRVRIIPMLTTIVNRVDVIFYGADPTLREITVCSGGDGKKNVNKVADKDAEKDVKEDVEEDVEEVGEKNVKKETNAKTHAWSAL